MAKRLALLEELTGIPADMIDFPGYLSRRALGALAQARKRLGRGVSAAEQLSDAIEAAEALGL